MDEPFSALDAITRLGMQELLLQLIADRQSAVILVTHGILSCGWRFWKPCRCLPRHPSMAMRDDG